ncbi:MAG: hypothetical protein WCL32_25010 [Planctomycetota bacterium]
MLPPDLLRRLRNDLPIPVAIAALAAPRLLLNSQEFGNRNLKAPKFVQPQFGNECDQNSARDT